MQNIVQFHRLGKMDIVKDDAQDNIKIYETSELLSII